MPHHHSSQIQAALAALAARPDGQRQIRNNEDLTKEEHIVVIQMIKRALQASTPDAEVAEPLVRKVFSLVFAPQWIATWPPIAPTEKGLRFEDAALNIGVWREDLPAPARGHEVEDRGGGGIDDDDDEVATATPRKRARMRAAGVTVFQERKKGAPAFLRPFVRDCGILDVSFTDSRGRRAPDNCVAYFGGGEKLSGDVIARAVLHHDANEMQRVKAFNQMLLVFLIRRYIHKLVTGQEVGIEASYKYSKPVLVAQGLEAMSRALEVLKSIGEGRTVEQGLFD